MDSFIEYNKNASAEFDGVAEKKAAILMKHKNEKLGTVAAYNKLYSLFHSVLHKDATGRFTHKKVERIKKIIIGCETVDLPVNGIEITTSKGVKCVIGPGQYAYDTKAEFSLSGETGEDYSINEVLLLSHTEGQWNLTIRSNTTMSGALDVNGVKFILNYILRYEG
ncbi:hypothetical protein PC510_003811 [Escherichia coli]|uniref:hypothetical protein n=1 Tax=Escherichia coli TaxID=562 RepID=UPI001835744B|nr:hypothetical protein [Escherichia coli]EKI3096537.1 hypothetical protein [Escherichia coli]MBB9841036.1 hypothetical protein [Escherichia coli]MBS9328462.1 hypothetical protein [Escherichia coli]